MYCKYDMIRLNDTNEETLEETLEDNNDLIDVRKYRLSVCTSHFLILRMLLLS